jgi:DNA-binding MarR family transcriptional regulator
MRSLKGLAKPQITPQLIYDFLSSARVFAKAVRDVIEADVLREVAGDKLTMPQLKLLYLVAQTESVTIGDAAYFLGVSSPAASKTVEKLVRRRLLRRNDIRGDRRSSELSLTEQARRLLENYEAARNQRAADIFAEYSPEVLRDTAEVLDHLASGIARQRMGVNPDETCLQCEIYFRQECRFGKFGACNCYYKSKKNRKRGVETDLAPVADKVRKILDSEEH